MGIVGRLASAGFGRSYGSGLVAVGALACGLVLGCGGDDGDGSNDGGATPRDAGAPLDAGGSDAATMRIDSGFWSDAGRLAGDAGLARDAGEPLDASRPDASRTDAGVVPDAGPAILPWTIGWVRQLGHGASDEGYDVLLDSSGNVYFVAVIAADGGASPTPSGVVVSYDAAGAPRWQRSFAGTVTPHSIALDSHGEIIVGGAFSGTTDFGGGTVTARGEADAFLTRLRSSDGTFVRAAQYGAPGASCMVRSVDTSSVGDEVLVIGTFDGSVDFGTGALSAMGGTDLFVISQTPSGTANWTRAFGGPLDDEGTGINGRRSDIIYLTGSFQGTARINDSRLTSAGGTDIMFVALERDGRSALTTSYGSPGDDRGNGIDFAGSDQVYLAGAISNNVRLGGMTFPTAGGEDALIARFEGEGTPRAVRPLGGEMNDEAFDVAVVPGGMVGVGRVNGRVVFGTTETRSRLPSDTPFFASYGFDGRPEQLVRLDVAGTARAVSASAHDVVLIGSFEGTGDLGAGAVSSAGGTDVFVVKLTR